MATFDRAYRKPALALSRADGWTSPLVFTVVLAFFLLAAPALEARAFETPAETLSLDHGIVTDLPAVGLRFTLTVDRAGLLVVEANPRAADGRHSSSLSLRTSTGQALVPIPAPPIPGRRIHWVSPGVYTLEVMPGDFEVGSSEQRIDLLAWWVEGQPLHHAEGILDDFDKDGEPNGGEDPPHEPADEWDEDPFTLPDPDKDGEPNGGDDPPHEPADEWDEGSTPGELTPLSLGNTLWLEAPGHGLLALSQRGARFFPLCRWRDRPNLLTTSSCGSVHGSETDLQAPHQPHG